jgi:(1->4)-alpha-D-glucan 1-alpha-D-glucosylmutase
VPDLYQGHELVALTLVDPDNRGPVDYALRREALAALKALAADPVALPGRVRTLLQSPHDGRAKLWVTWRALELRRRDPTTFEQGDYAPVTAAGERARHVVAYARRRGQAGVVAVAGRLFASLGLDTGVPPLGLAAWGDTTLDLAFIPAGTALANVLTGETLTATGGALPLAQVCAHFPGAILAYGTTAA